MPERLRIVFMGTPDFAVASLKSLLQSKHDIVGVITAPDKPAGRGKKLSSSPVKVFAKEAGIKNILQPSNLKNPEFLSELKSLNADLQIVVAFRMLPEAVWEMPPIGTINLHASLLPDYRGAAPINWALINGETETGVTTFFIEKEIDTGKIIYSEKVTISPRMDAGELHDLLMETGAKLLVKTADAVASGDYPQVPQNKLMGGKLWNEAPKIFKDDCKITWDNSPKEIHNFIRGLSPYPAAWSEISDGNQTLIVKIFKVEKEEIRHEHQIGHILSDGKSYLKVAVPEGLISILTLQLAGKKRMQVDELLRGFKEIDKYHFIHR